MWRLLIMPCVRLIVVVCFAEIVVIGPTRTAYSDALLAYEAIAPGQLSSALASYPCDVRVMPESNRVNAYCEFTAQDTAFKQAIAVGDTHKIERLILEVKENRLYLGDLLRCWGKPSDVQALCSSNRLGDVCVYWGKSNYALIHTQPSGSHLSPFLPIAELVIETEWRACNS